MKGISSPGSEDTVAEAINEPGIEDDTDVPLSEVIADMFPSGNSTQSGYSTGQYGGLGVNRVEEDVWAYDDSGALWGTGGSVPTLEEDEK